MFVYWKVILFYCDGPIPFFQPIMNGIRHMFVIVLWKFYNLKVGWWMKQCKQWLSEPFTDSKSQYSTLREVHTSSSALGLELEWFRHFIALDCLRYRLLNSLGLNNNLIQHLWNHAKTKTMSMTLVGPGFNLGVCILKGASCITKQM